MTAPEGLVASLTTEFYHKNPEILKTQHLKAVKEIFPKHCDPFYAGFGNRISVIDIQIIFKFQDELCYLAVNLASDKIYLVDKKGNIVCKGNKQTT